MQCIVTRPSIQGSAGNPAIAFMLQNNGNSSHFFVRSSPKISPPRPLYSIPVCKKNCRNLYDIYLLLAYFLIQQGKY